MADLPEICIALILSHTSPLDVSKLALVNRTFWEASRADLVWERMMPSYYEGLEEVASKGLRFASRKEQYYRLSNRFFSGTPTQGFWMDRATGGVCHSLSARMFSIAASDDPQCWEWFSQPGSRFPDVAYYKALNSVEVRGNFECTLPRGAYTLSWRLQLAGIQPIFRAHYLPYSSYTVDHTMPFKFDLSTGDGQHTESHQYLDCSNDHSKDLSSTGFPEISSQKWVEYDGGNFLVESEDTQLQLEFSMTEGAMGIWRSGFLLDGIVIRPVALVEREYQRVVVETRERQRVMIDPMESLEKRERVRHLDDWLAPEWLANIKEIREGHGVLVIGPFPVS